jgi:tetratricopeptide (TPR) repeat protein
VWRSEGLQRLDAAASIALLERVAGAKVAQQVGARVIEELGGLPVHLLPTARTLARRARLGRLREQDLLELSEEGAGSFSIPWQALDTAARLLLQTAARWFNPNALMEAELVAALASSFQGEAVVRNAVDACREVYVLQGEERLGMHQLLVRFAKAQPPERLGVTGAQDLGPAVAAALQKAAERVASSPADGEALAAWQCHQLSWDFWRQQPVGLSVAGSHLMGRAHLEMGQWQEAAGWYEQAVAEKRQGDVFGRVDSNSVALSVDALAYCRRKLGSPSSGP